ncbi:MAG: hypothetical protein ABI661_03005, partial [Gammaproteobacteria bacterium]
MKSATHPPAASAKVVAPANAGPPATIHGPAVPGAEAILNERALALVAHLHRQFNGRRLELLARRHLRQAELDAGQLPGFLADTAAIRAGAWRVAPVPDDLRDR